MFKHSIKVPRLYKTAAKIIQEVSEGNGSIKSLVYERKHPNVKAVYFLVIITFKKSNDIDNLLKRTQLLIKEPRLDPWLARILISELLWGKKRLASESKPVQTILAYEQIFKAHLSDLADVDATVYLKDDLKKPRYVRINTLLMSLNEAIDSFKDEEWKLYTKCDKNNYKAFLKKISCLEEDEFVVDIHIPNLLIFPPKTEFFKHPGYKNGSLILQDKASCFPVHILSPPPGSIVLDMCAAPGMKTTQIAALMQNEGTVYAVERDERRFEILNKMIQSSGATCIRTFNKDVLQCDGTVFPGVEYILVDPSCSGSGITDRLEYDKKESNSRLSKLAGFQIKILRSALVRYPEAKRIVYSTCSIFPEENEDVVRQVLETNENFKLVPAVNFINDSWFNFGSPEFGDIGNFCMYAKPYEDLTNGFFVAVFERLQEGEENVFFNSTTYHNIKCKQQRKKQKHLATDEVSNQKYEQTDSKLEVTENNVKTMENLLLEEQPSSSRYKKSKHKHDSKGLQQHQQQIDVANSSPKKKKRNKTNTSETENSSVTGQDDTNTETEIQATIKHKKKSKKKTDVGDAAEDAVDFKASVLEKSVKSGELKCKRKKMKSSSLKPESFKIASPKIKKFKKSNDLVTDIAEHVVECVDLTDALHSLQNKKRKKAKKEKHFEVDTLEVCEENSGTEISYSKIQERDVETKKASKQQKMHKMADVL